MGERRRTLPSVRVRVTMAATAVTALTVVATGLVLVRQVEGSQLSDLARRTEARVDEVAGNLAAGQRPYDAVQSTTTDVSVQVTDERGCPVAASPLVSAGGSQVGTFIGGEAGQAQTTGVGAGTPADDVLMVTTADGTTIRCPVPEGFGPPEDADPSPKAVASTEESSATGASVPSTGSPGARDWLPGPPMLNRLRLMGEGAVSPFPFERVARNVRTAEGTYRVEAAAPVDEVRRSVDAVRQALWWALPALIATVAAVAWVLVGRALRPVEAIRAEVEAIGGTTMHRRVPEPRSGDEVGRLARTMNAMLGRLETSARRQRQFVSDASHELRSPVATIRADVEVAQLEGPAADWPAVAASVLREEARLERLIDDLLVLAAADESRPPPRTARVDLARVASDDASRARRVPVVVTAPAAPVDVEGDAGQLRQVVANLVDNAARHAGTRVEVGVAARPDGQVRLTVDDDGDGIAPADRERVFERFARLDEGRARDRGGAGLGLAVVRSLVERHRGTVVVEESPAGGARVVVDLPPVRTSATTPRGPEVV